MLDVQILYLVGIEEQICETLCMFSYALQSLDMT